jgi:hypothetical protein
VRKAQIPHAVGVIKVEAKRCQPNKNGRSYHVSLSYSALCELFR